MNIYKILKNFWWSLLASQTLNCLSEAVFIVDKNGVIKHSNKKAQELFDIEFCENNSKIEFDSIIKDGMQELKKSLNLEKPIVSKAIINGEEKYVELNVSKRKDINIVSLRDTTKLINEFLTEEKIKKFNNEKNAMLAKIEADVKSPLNSITGFSQGLLGGLGGELTERQEKYIKIINDNAEEMYKFLDAFFEFSYAEASIYAPEYKKFDIVELFRSILKEQEQEFEKKEITYDFNCFSIEKRNIYTDYKAFQKIFRNIIEISLSMTDAGMISIRLAHPDKFTCENYNIDISEEKLGSYLQLTIEDTGVGVAQEDMRYLCEPYAYLEKGKKNLIRSLKLGTASILTKRVNGYISISSEVMVGTVYNIIFPIEKELNE